MINENKLKVGTRGMHGLTTGERFFKVWDFMIGDLGLEKTELLVYAIIFSIYQNYQDCYAGTKDYLAKWTGASRRTVTNALDSLVEKKLILKGHRKILDSKRAVYLINTDALPECEMFSVENKNREMNRIFGREGFF